MLIDRLEKFQIFFVGVIIAFAIMSCSKMITKTITGNVITVTGSAYEIIKSDSGSLNFTINTKSQTKQGAYQAAQQQLKIVKKYLNDNKISKIELKTVNGYYNYKTDSKGNYTSIPENYNLFQPIIVSSNDVNVIKEISNNITGLISQGVDITVNNASYDYSKLPDLKVSLLEKASVDAKNRAASMLKATHNSVGKIQAVKMGVYQITPVDSTDVSDSGINDSSTIDKKVTAVANITFKIK